MSKTKEKADPKYSMVQFPRALWVKLGIIAAASRRRRPEVIQQVCGPAIEQELSRLFREKNGKVRD